MDDIELWHGDARTLVADLPAGINCVVTDPPYGVDFQSRKATTPGGKKWVQDIEGDKGVDAAVELFHDIMVPICDKLADEADVYVFTRWDIVDVWMDAVKALPNLKYKMLGVWAKGYPGLGDIDANWGCGHELILYCKKGRRDVAHRRSFILHHDKVHATQHIHPTEKPVPLLEELIAMSTNPGDLVVDPFAGSASTLVAARNLGRRAIGIEKDDTFYARASERLQQSTFAF